MKLLLYLQVVRSLRAGGMFPPSVNGVISRTILAYDSCRPSWTISFEEIPRRNKLQDYTTWKHMYHIVALLIPQTKHHVIIIDLFKTSLWFLSHVFQCLCASPTASQCQGDLQGLCSLAFASSMLWSQDRRKFGPIGWNIVPLDRSRKLEHRMSFYLECIYSRYFSLTVTYVYNYIYVCSIDS